MITLSPEKETERQRLLRALSGRLARSPADPHRRGPGGRTWTDMDPSTGNYICRFYPDPPGVY